MKQLIKNNRTGTLTVENVPSPCISEGFLLVKNIFSAVSIGTETASIEIAKKNLLEKAKSRPDDLKKILASIKQVGVLETYFKAMDRLSLPTPVGYSSVGKVLEKSSEIKDLDIGDIVACGGSGHAEIIKVPRNLCVKVPPNTNIEYASLTTIAAIALQGIRQSGSKSGETVLVIGLGLIGNITMKLLDLMGCFPVGIDLSSERIKQASSENFIAFNRADKSLENKLLGITNDVGFDSVLITASTDNNDPIEFASNHVRDRGQITIVGNVKLNLSRKAFYNKELNLNLSRSYGPGRYDTAYELKGQDYPLPYVRWTENRNMELIIKYINQKKLNFSNLVKEKYPFNQAPEFYKNIKEREIAGAIFEYDDKIETKDFVVLKQKTVSKKINIGVIGAGNYAQNVILPILSKNKNINLVGLSTTTGSRSKHISQKYDFSYCTTNYEKILEDREINTVLILTRHDTHSELVLAALSNKKDVFVEKPLAIQKKDLLSIKRVMQKSDCRLWVGFNRRFSPHTTKAKDFFEERTTPLAINYRVNVGTVDSSHWSNDLEIGGGRIIGECCHFIDFCSFVTDSEPINYKFSYLDSKNSNLNYKDSVSLILEYADGSIATINYLTNGNKKYSKERVEIFGENSIAVIDDFKKSDYITEKSSNTFKTRRSEKGHVEQLSTFLNSTNTMDFNSIYNTTKITLEM